MKRINAVLLVLAIIIFPLPAHASENPAEIRRYAVETGHADGYCSVQLLADIYNHAAPGLADLRLIDGSGVAVPYFVHDAAVLVESENAVFPAERVGSFSKDGDAYYDFAIEKTADSDVFGNSVALTVNGGYFAKEITAYGSHDGVKWDTILNTLIYSVDGDAQTEIDLGGTYKYAFYRIMIPNDAEKVALESAELRYTAKTARAQGFSAVLMPAFTRVEQPESTQLSVDAALLRGLRLTDVTLEASGMFSRAVQTPLGAGTLQNLSFKDRTIRDTTLTLGPGIYTDDEAFTVTIHNADDTPLEIEALVFTYACDRVVFRAEPDKSYTLVLDPAQAERPDYDIARYAGHVLRENMTPCAYVFEGVQTVPGADEPDGRTVPDTWLLNGALAAVSVLLIILIARAALRKKQ